MKGARREGRWRAPSQCPKCGMRLQESMRKIAEYCPYCGEGFPKGGYCKDCDKDYASGRYCPIHGTELKARS